MKISFEQNFRFTLGQTHLNDRYNIIQSAEQLKNSNSAVKKGNTDTAKKSHEIE